MGQAEGSVLQVWKYGSWQSSSKPRSGRVDPKMIPSLWDTAARKPGRALLRMASRQNGVRDQASHLRKQQTARSYSLHWWLSHQRPVRVGFHCQARCNHHPWRHYSLYSLNLQLNNGSTAYTVSTSSLTMEVEAVTHALHWIALRGDSQTTHAVILTDSMSLVQQVKSRTGSPDWNASVANIHPRKLLWVYCPGHAWVKGND